MEKSEFEHKSSNLIETVTFHPHGFICIGQENNHWSGEILSSLNGR